MISSVYKKLFNVVVAHDFYVDYISKKDLAVVPTEETVSVMKNNNMLFRTNDGGFRVFYRVDDGGASFVNFSNLHLVFALKLENIAGFLNFTNLKDTVSGTDYTNGKIIYFTNKANPQANELVYSLLDYLKPAVFTYAFPTTAGSPGHIEIKNSDNVVVTPSYPDPNTLVPDVNGNYTYPIDFTGMPKGIYKFKTWGSNPMVTTTKTIYIDNDLAKQNIFGIVDIFAISGANSSFPAFPPVPTPPPDPVVTVSRVYNMRFVRRNTRWKYIVVIQSPSVSPTDTLDIKDSVTQLPYGMLSFTEQTIVPPLTVNGAPAKVFLSDLPLMIPYYETPKKNLDIRKDPAGTPVTIIKNIPGPPLYSVSGDPADPVVSQIYVYI